MICKAEQKNKDILNTLKRVKEESFSFAVKISKWEKYPFVKFLLKNFAVTGPKEYPKIHVLILLHTRLIKFRNVWTLYTYFDKSVFSVWIVAMVTRRLLWSMCRVRAWASPVVLMITGLAHSLRQAICKNNCSVPLHNVLVNSFPKQIKKFSTKLFFP